VREPTSPCHVSGLAIGEVGILTLRNTRCTTHATMPTSGVTKTKGKKGKPTPAQANVAMNRVEKVARQVGKMAAKLDSIGVPYAGAVKAIADMAPAVYNGIKGQRARLRKLMGSGDYVVGNLGSRDTIHNSLVHDPVRVDDSFGRSKCTDYEVYERVFCLKVVTDNNTGATTINSIPVTAGNRQLFRRLERVSKLYARYCIQGLVFEAESEFMRLSSDGAQGMWAMTCNPNPYSKGTRTEDTLLNTNGAVAAGMHTNLVYGVECAPDHTTMRWLYTDRNSVTDVAFHTMCKLEVAVKAPVGLSSGTLVGRLYATYHITFCEPILPLYTCPTLAYSGTGATNTNPAGTGSISCVDGFVGSTYDGLGVFTLRDLAEGDVVHVSLIWNAGTATTVAYINNWITAAGMSQLTTAPTGAVANPVCAPQNGATGVTRMQAEVWYVVTRTYPPPVFTLGVNGTDLVPPANSTFGMAMRVVGAGMDVSTTFYTATVQYASPRPIYPLMDDEDDELGQGAREYVAVDRLSQEEVDLIETMRRARLNVDTPRATAICGPK